MSITKKLATKEFSVEIANSFVDTFNTDDNSYFMFVGQNLPYDGSDGTIAEPEDSIQSSVLDVYDNMIFAKKLANTDVVQMVPKYLWTDGETYAEYNHQDGELYDKNFFVMVDDDTEYNVYKCLFNNSNTEVSDAPARVGSEIDLEPIITSDGYVWKYMYTINRTQYEKYATKTYIPVIANTDVIEAATAGTIDVIKVIDGGAGYDNYIANGVFRAGDIEVGGVSDIYAAPEDASAIDDFYKGCVLKITSGAGANQYRRILSYDGESSTKKFTLDSGFTIVPSDSDTYEVYPYIYVWGDGNETTSAEAVAIIETTANSISTVEILSAGAGYRFADLSPGAMPSVIPIVESTTQIDLPDVITLDEDFEAATLEPIISPPYGHGGNPWHELGASRVCVSGKFNQSEDGVFPVENDFRQVGLLKNPLFTNVSVSLNSNSIVGSFSIGEEFYQYKRIKLFGTVSMEEDTNTIIKKDYGKISNTVTILNSGTGYDSTANNELVFDNTGTGGSAAAGTFANNGSGVITTVTITNQGSNYETVPTVSINPTAAAGGSNAQLQISLANPEITAFDEALEAGMKIMVDDGSSKYIDDVASVTNAYTITTSANTGIEFSNASLSILTLQTKGIVTSVASSVVTLNNVDGPFEEDSNVLGLSSSATGTIATSNGTFDAITINDRDAGSFDKSLQLIRLVGNYTVGGSPFIEDEDIEQDSLIDLYKGTGSVHHIEINGGSDDDVVYINNKRGVFNLDPAGEKTIRGQSSSATLENLSNKYPGDFVVDSGKVIYVENLDAVTRSDNKSEIIKLILEF